MLTRLFVPHRPEFAVSSGAARLYDDDFDAELGGARRPARRRLRFARGNDAATNARAAPPSSRLGGNRGSWKEQHREEFAASPFIDNRAAQDVAIRPSRAAAAPIRRIRIVARGDSWRSASARGPRRLFSVSRRAVAAPAPCPTPDPERRWFASSRPTPLKNWTQETFVRFSCLIFAG